MTLEQAKREVMARLDRVVSRHEQEIAQAREAAEKVLAALERDHRQTGG